MRMIFRRPECKGVDKEILPRHTSVPAFSLFWREVICFWLVLVTTNVTTPCGGPRTAAWLKDLNGDTQLGRNYS